MGGSREDEALAALVAGSAAVPSGRVEAYGPHPDQRIEWYASGGSRRAPVVLVHGGFFRPAVDRSHARLAAVALADELAAPVVLVEYRRVAGQPQSTVADIHSVSDLLEGLDEEPSVWVGHSAGGALVLQRAFDERRPPVCAVALAPLADLVAAVREGIGDGAVTTWLGARTAAKPSRYLAFDPARCALDVPERRGRVVCLHGEDDRTVPPSQSGRSGLPHRILPLAHHYDLIDPGSAAWPLVVAAIRTRRTQP